MRWNMALGIGDPDTEQREQESGGKLREQLEAALAKNRDYEETLGTYKARDVLGDKFDLVKPEDLKGVPLDKLEERAGQIQQERADLQAELLRDVLSKQGYEGEDLDDMVEQMTSRKTEESAAAEATSRVRQAGSIAAPPVKRVDASKLEAFDAIRASMDQPAKKRS